MELHQDYKELLQLFNENQVEYVIVGGYALAFHGAPRTTKDIDILIYSSADNIKRIIQALEQFGFSALEIEHEDLARPYAIIQLGYAPVRVDIVNEIDGVKTEDAINTAVLGKFGDIAVPFLCRDVLIENKRATGRPRDLADLQDLGVE